MKTLLLSAATALALTITTHAAIYNWNAADGNWNDPVNWNPNGSPGPDDNVFINSGTAGITGGNVSNTGAYIGHFADSDGTVTVSGGGTWTNSGELLVGFAGDGTLNIHGGTVSGTHAYIGHFAGSNGTVTVSNGGTWTNSNQLGIGREGTGTLNIDGGIVFSDLTYIGAVAAGTGTATVSNGGVWNNTSAIFVGSNGDGTLNIENGTVRANFVIIASSGTGAGRLNLHTGGTLETDYIQKGYGTATLNLNGGILRATTSTPADQSFFKDFSDIALNGAGLAAHYPALVFDTGGHAVIINNKLTFNPGDTDTALIKIGAGTLTIKKAPDFGTGKMQIDAGTLALDCDSPTFTGAVTNNAALRLDRPGTYTFSGGFENNGLLRIGNPDSLYPNTYGITAKLGNLTSANNQSVISLELDLADRNNSGRLLADTVAGTHTIDIRTLTGTEAVTGKDFTCDLIEAAAPAIKVRLAGAGTGSVTFDPASQIRLAGDGSVTAGTYRLGIVGDANATLRVIGINGGAQALVNTIGALTVGWFSQTDNLLKRVGDLRLAGHRKPTDTGLDLWLRGYGQRTNIDLGIADMSSFREYQYGVDVGGDKAFTLDGQNTLYLGTAAGYQGATRRFDDGYGSEGETDGVSLALYATWIHADGWYAAAAFKGQYFDNSYEADGDRGEFDSYGLGTDIELGKQWLWQSGWFVEPSVQFSYAHIFNEDYATNKALAVNPRDANIYRFSGQVRFGKNCVLGNWGIIQPYAKIGVEQQISDGGEVNFATESYAPNTDGTRMTYGVGFAWQLDAAQQIHFEYEGSFGDKYDKPWGINAGYRYAW